MKTRANRKHPSSLQCSLRAVAGISASILLLPLAVPGEGVVTECTEANLRAAIAGGGTVTFACDGTITLASTITNELNTTVDASGHQITISGGNTIRVFYVTTNTTLELINLGVANGSAPAGAGVFNDGGTLVLQQTVFRANFATNGIGMEHYYPFMCSGGGIFNRAGTLHATNSSFIGNRAGFPREHFSDAINPIQGGAIVNAAGQMFLHRCDFTENAAVGPPGYSSGSGPGSPGITGLGGAIYNTGETIFYECTFRRNDATGGSGGTASPTAIGYPGNAGGDAAGGACWNEGVLRLRNCFFTGNSAVGGSGSSGCPGGNGGPGGDGRGGGVFNSGTATLENCTVASNLVVGGNGGPGGAGASGITSGGVGGNGGNGGDALGSLWSANGLFITNCTIAINLASSGAGGSGGEGGINTDPPIIQQSPGVAGTNGFAVGGLKGAGTLVNTLLAGNASGNCTGSAVDAGHNLSSDSSCAFTNAGSLNNTDPLLGPLTDNGGPTLTLPLLAGSPAIDAGDNTAAPPRDQRGWARIGRADIGAFEYWAQPPAAPTLLPPPPAQTVEAGSAAHLKSRVAGYPPPTCQWRFNDTIILSGTNAILNLDELDFTHSGIYTLVVSNLFGCSTSAPVQLNVIPAVARRPVPGIHFVGSPGIVLNLEHAEGLSPQSQWLPLGSFLPDGTPQDYFDLTDPLPPQRYYRTQTNGKIPPMLDLHMIPALTLTGTPGGVVRVDAINAIGPTDAWFTLDTVTLTNTTQLYFDVTAPGQPERLYRLIQLP